MSRGRLIVVAGPSGIGKGTVCGQLRQLHPELALSISCTTRDMRPGDVEGVTYFFKTEQEFDQMIAADQFLEHAGIYGRRYGTPRDYVESMLAQGRDVLLEIETQGARQVMAKSHDVVSIFLLPPTMQELRRRLYTRATETEEKARARYASAYAEIRLAREYDYVLINDDLQETVRRMCAILETIHLRPDDAEAHIQKLEEEIL